MELTRRRRSEMATFTRAAAENATAVVTAPDTLQLLGLAVLASRRGINATKSTDSEVDALLRLDGAV
jgi:hypothetical protein